MLEKDNALWHLKLGERHLPQGAKLRSTVLQGCQIFHGTTYQIGGKYIK
jgi:hypothetical protein